ncbi:MAG: transglutaminase domain-containing protein [Planctomycetes bacterium]|nr:transglutaminase domain-containing protein [Planctomycetota bacterium]
MTATPVPTPRPRRKLLKTWLRRPRSLERFAPRISAEEVLADPPDPAEAAHWGEYVLLEDLVVALHRDGTASRRMHLVTMPHGDQNLAEWDEKGGLYDPRKWRPTVRRAAVYVPDETGRFLPPGARRIPKKQRRKAKKHVWQATMRDWAMRLVFAPLRPGVAVEFDHQIDHFVPDEAGPVVWGDFVLHWLWPCRRRRITLAVAEPFTARFELHHCDFAPEESQQGRYRVYRWDLRDLAGIEADAWTPPPRDFAPWIDFSTLHDWEPVARHYAKDILPGRKIPKQIKELAQQLNQQAGSDREKAMTVFQYAARDVRYGRHPSELEAPRIRDAVQMLEDLRGDCKDKSSLMVSLLSEMGVPAKVAILLTSMNGRRQMLPSRRFDHAIVIAKVDGQDLWFDPAAGPYTFGELPLNDQGVQALLLGDNQQGDAFAGNGQARMIDIPQDLPERQLVERRCQGALTAEGDYTYQVHATITGERAAMYRMMLLDRHEDHRRRVIAQSVAEERPGAEVDEIEIDDLADLSRHVGYHYQVKLRRWGRPVKDLLLFRVPWAEAFEFTGPISAAQRQHPLQAPPVMRLVEEHEIQLPPGFTGYALPYEATHRCQWLEYGLSITSEEHRLICRRRMESRGGVAPTERFAEFRAFWEECTRADHADVVLIKG